MNKSLSHELCYFLTTFNIKIPRHRSLISDPDMHPGTCVTHVPLCMPGSLTSGFLWSRWRGERSRHSRRMRIHQFYVSDKRPMAIKMGESPWLPRKKILTCCAISMHWEMEQNFIWKHSVRKEAIYSSANLYSNYELLIAIYFHLWMMISFCKLQIYFHFLSLSNNEMVKMIKILPRTIQLTPILHSQYHGCWYPGEGKKRH